MKSFTRRRFLTVSAAAIGASRAGAMPASTTWRGSALGAEARLIIAGMDAGTARPVLLALQAELWRLEGIFSLYRPDSALSRLNAQGRLAVPPPELLSVLSLCDRLHRVTGGAFDPTVQPLFAAYAAASVTGTQPEAPTLKDARDRVGWAHVVFDGTEVAFRRPGMALTLNGVAQGVIADRIRDLAAANGLTDILVDMGEIAAMGHRSGGRGWQVGVVRPGGSLVSRVTLNDRALATSSPGGTVLDPDGRTGHIFSPATGAPAPLDRVISVSAPTAGLADGLSTAFCLLPPDVVRAALAACPEARLEVSL